MGHLLQQHFAEWRLCSAELRGATSLAEGSSADEGHPRIFPRRRQKDITGKHYVSFISQQDLIGASQSDP